MQPIVTCFIGVASGGIVAAIQWRIFTRDSSLKKPFIAHFKELRLHCWIAIAVMLAVSALLVLVQDWFEVLSHVPKVFFLSWFTVMCLHLRRVLRDSSISSK